MANGERLLAANLALWVAHGQLATSLRYAGTSDLDGPGDMGDVALLVGVHPINESHVNGVLAIGPGVSFAHNALGTLPEEPVIALSGQLIANAAVFGIGFDTFAGFGRARHYYGIGLAIGIGGFSGVAPGP